MTAGIWSTPMYRIPEIEPMLTIAPPPCSSIAGWRVDRSGTDFEGWSQLRGPTGLPAGPSALLDGKRRPCCEEHQLNRTSRETALPPPRRPYPRNVAHRDVAAPSLGFDQLLVSRTACSSVSHPRTFANSQAKRAAVAPLTPPRAFRTCPGDQRYLARQSPQLVLLWTVRGSQMLPWGRGEFLARPGKRAPAVDARPTRIPLTPK